MRSPTKVRRILWVQAKLAGITSSLLDIQGAWPASQNRTTLANNVSTACSKVPTNLDNTPIPTQRGVDMDIAAYFAGFPLLLAHDHYWHGKRLQ